MGSRESLPATTWLFAALFLAIGVTRGVRALAIAPVPDLPALLFVAVLGQAVGALLAGIALGFAGRSAALGLALFAGCAVLQMGGDTFVYGVRSLFEGLAFALLAMTLTFVAWLLSERDRVPRVRFRRLEIPGPV